MVAAGVEWASLTVAGAFIAGAILGSAATLHAVRSVVALFDRRRRREEEER